MYPNLYYAFKDLFGVEINGLKLINSFGFFVALAFGIAGWVLSKELIRKEKQGIFSFTEEKITVGGPVSITDWMITFLLGFVFGYKFIGAFLLPDVLQDPPAYIFSWNGHLGAGIVIGLVMVALKYREFKQQQMPKPEIRTIRIWPHDRLGDIILYAAGFGFLGAKIFHNLENWNEFSKDPIGSLLSFSGLTFYGGLICATIAIIYYARKHSISVIHLADCMAPTMMLAYALGRIGCQVSGDGDWGIANTRANPFSFLPDWAWSYRYPHNVIGEGVPIDGCTGAYCMQLPQPVYPTALYEIVMCLLLFVVIWFLRKKIRIPGQLAGLYLMLNGAERFLIEQIRVNTRYESLPLQPTQAQIISTLLLLSG
ncbi:MAG: prolipoprotein diacylglyceryl transferase, partial [Sediminibacterium sp.]|nr:prolipoprotein diacylglyceryl transferase [Sediminibacterium sp.]